MIGAPSWWDWVQGRENKRGQFALCDDGEKFVLCRAVNCAALRPRVPACRYCTVAMKRGIYFMFSQDGLSTVFEKA